MRHTRSVLASLLACALVLGACGSTSRSKRTVALNTALRRLQAEVEQQRSKFSGELRRLGGNVDTLGSISLVYAAPPKGVSRAEWAAAVSRDVALQRAFASLNRHGPPEEPPSTAEVEQSRRAAVETERHRPPHMIKRRHGALRSVRCHETTRGVWFCTLRFDEGLVVVERAAWYQNAALEGISLVSERKA